MIRRRGDDGAARRPAPRLVLRFTIFTAVGLAVASAAIFLTVRGVVTTQARTALEQNTRFVAQSVLARKLSAEDFERPPSVSRRRALDRLFDRQVMVDDVERASLYGRDGTVAYSTDPELTGRRTELSDEVAKALRGTRIETVVEDEVVAGGAQRTVLRQIVPIGFGGSPVGALVTTRDYGPVARSVRATVVPVAIVLEALLLALFASLFPILRRATRQMDSQFEAIEHQALHDGLTGLPNRALFRDRIDHALASARRTAGKAGVMLLDLDRFKEINDALGHASGDALLAQLGDRLRETLRETDTIARLGGDEFGIVMEVAGPEDVLDAARRIHVALERPFHVSGLELEVGASIGGVIFPDDALDADTLVRFADVAMYAAKRNRTGVELYDPAEDGSSRESLALASSLRQALGTGEILAHYQPKVDLGTGLIVGAEALVRWNHAERGLVAPGGFLPLVEKAGLMGALTTRVLSLAVHQAAAWDRLGVPLGTAVNVDVGALLDPTFPSTVRAILDEAGLPPERLTLEITETSLMADPVLAGRVADQLAGIGVRLSIDDFGTGYSSLGHLTKLPLAELKIDRSFVHRMTESATDMTIVRTILDLGASLDLAVVAEGIESDETRRILQGLGCRLAQGYRFGPALPPDELSQLLLGGSARPAPAVPV